LPEFGWQPTVLTIREDAIGSNNSLDPSLSRLIPANVCVVRTRLFRTIEKATQSASRILQLGGLPRVGVGGFNEAQTSNGIGAHPNSAKFKVFLSLFVKRLSATPDSEIGWFIPALWSGLRLLKQEQFSAILCTGPPHSAHLIASCLGKIARKPVLLDFRDPWARKPWGDHRQRSINNRMERWCVHCASRVVLNTEAACQEFRANYVTEPSSKFMWIPNGTDPDIKLFHHMNVGNSAVNTLQPTYSFCHPGEVYGERSLLPFLRALSILRKRGVCARLEQIGDVSQLGAVEEEIMRLGLRDVVVLRGQQSHSTVLRALNAATFALVIQPKAEMQVPAKIFEMLHFGKPILALTGAGATADIVRRFKLGIVEESNDAECIAAAATELIRRYREFACGDGWELAKLQFDGRALTRVLAETLDSIVTKH
jgi:glycosyltransferase involved in cell wall biosynthesis